MKNLIRNKPIMIALAIFTFTLYSCNDDDDDSTTSITDPVVSSISNEEKAGLLFMLEEEKLARDTYEYLFTAWGDNTFGNIKTSEQSHMDAISGLLDDNNIAYTILPMGEFEDQDLQNFYNKFIIDGEISLLNALSIGALIEDLDIVDLQDYIDNTSNTSILAVYNTLQCGSRNHLRSYVSNIETNGGTYAPQFLSLDDYTTILSGGHENCN
jgi:hypothetical protein